MAKRQNKRNGKPKLRQMRATEVMRRKEAEAIERALDEGIVAAGEVTASLALLDLDLVGLDFRSRVMSLGAARDAAQTLWEDEEDDGAIVDGAIDVAAEDTPSPDGDSGK